MNGSLIFSGIVSLAILCFASPADAACTSPAGVEGDQFYNTTTDTMQFCNGSDQWVNMGVPDEGGGGVTDEVGAVTNGQWCRGNGTQVVCDQSPPVTSEVDPQVGTLTNNRWCRSDGTQVICDQNAPSSGAGCGGYAHMQVYTVNGWPNPSCGWTGNLMQCQNGTPVALSSAYGECGGG